MGLFDIPAESGQGTEGETAPLPPRSRRGLWLQFWFQWTYLLLGSVLLLAFVGLLLWGGGSGGGGDLGGIGGGAGSEIRIGGSMVLTRRQYRLERDGSREAWAERVRAALHQATERADKRRASRARSRAKAEAKATAKGKSLPPLTAVPDRLELALPVYRGAGLGAVEQAAAPLGWELDWKRTRTAKLQTACLTRQPQTQKSL